MSFATLIAVLLAGTLLFPAPARAQDDDLAYSERSIAPAVVRQGDFAVRLTEVLGLKAAPDDENDALHLLSGLAIQPENGWQPDLALTPPVVAELREDVIDAVAARRLDMYLETALAAFDDLLAELGLPQPAEPGPAYAGGGYPYSPYGPFCDATATRNFYWNYGLPHYSYCYPPSAFLHYYSWVPCGFRAHGHHFAGFFVLKQVHVIPRVRVVHKHHHHDGLKHEDRHRFQRRVLHTVPAPHVERRDAKQELSRLQSRAMEHKSEIMQRVTPAPAPRAKPIRHGTGQRAHGNATPRHNATAPHAAHSPRAQAGQRAHVSPRPNGNARVRNAGAPPAAHARPQPVPPRTSQITVEPQRAAGSARFQSLGRDRGFR